MCYKRASQGGGSAGQGGVQVQLSKARSVWAYWSIGTWVVAVRAGGRIRASLVHCGRASVTRVTVGCTVVRVMFANDDMMAVFCGGGWVVGVLVVFFVVVGFFLWWGFVAAKKEARRRRDRAWPAAGESPAGNLGVWGLAPTFFHSVTGSAAIQKNVFQAVNSGV